MERINVRKPDHIPHATEYVEQMVQLVQSLIGLDKAYVTADGVYLSVEQVEGYGLLANQDLDSLREGGGDRAVVGTEKRHPADFALWKLAKEGEPSWPSPWGGGRPGWHTECVVMSLDILGEGFDIHAGGQPLRSAKNSPPIGYTTDLSNSAVRKCPNRLATLLISWTLLNLMIRGSTDFSFSNRTIGHRSRSPRPQC